MLSVRYTRADTHFFTEGHNLFLPFHVFCASFHPWWKALTARQAALRHLSCPSAEQTLVVITVKLHQHGVEQKDYIMTCSLFSSLYTQTQFSPPLLLSLQITGEKSLNSGLYLINHSNACSWLFLLEYKTSPLSLLTRNLFFRQHLSHQIHVSIFNPVIQHIYLFYIHYTAAPSYQGGTRGTRPGRAALPGISHSTTRCSIFRSLLLHVLFFPLLRLHKPLALLEAFKTSPLFHFSKDAY